MNYYFVELEIYDGDHVVRHSSVRLSDTPEQADQMARDGQSYGKSDYREFKTTRIQEINPVEAEILKRFI